MVQFRTYMTDASRFLTSPDVQDELRAQGRVLFTDGSWSPQGFADEEDGVNPSVIRYNGYWPTGKLNSDWTPCDVIDGGRCKPYEKEEMPLALTKHDDEQMNIILNEKGLWAPRIIQNLVEMGLDMGVWNVNSPETILPLCSSCEWLLTQINNAILIKCSPAANVAQILPHGNRLQHDLDTLIHRRTGRPAT